MNVFADPKVQRAKKDENSCKELLKDLSRLYEWNYQWQMELNAEKCM